MDTLVRKVMLILTLGAWLGKSEPPPPSAGLSGQYGLPGPYAPTQGNQYQQQQQSLTNSYGAPLGDNQHGHDEHQDYIDSQPKAYEFGYEVKDAASGNDYGRRESSDGETVRGEYRVQLPDGRTQIVTYTADWRTGFHADVRYEGVAQYPDQYNNAAAGQGYAPAANNQLANGPGYDYSSGAAGNVNNNVDITYAGAGNQAGYNNYQGSSGNGYNNNNNNGGYNYQFGSNSIDAGYAGNSGNTGSQSLGPSLAPPLQQPPPTSYGVPFH